MQIFLNRNQSSFLSKYALVGLWFFLYKLHNHQIGRWRKAFKDLKGVWTQIIKHADSINGILYINGQDVNNRDQSGIYSLEIVKSKPKTKGIEGLVRN